MAALAGFTHDLLGDRLSIDIVCGVGVVVMPLPELARNLPPPFP